MSAEVTPGGGGDRGEAGRGVRRGSAGGLRRRGSGTRVTESYEVTRPVTLFGWVIIGVVYGNKEIRLRQAAVSSPADFLLWLFAEYGPWEWQGGDPQRVRRDCDKLVGLADAWRSADPGLSVAGYADRLRRMIAEQPREPVPIAPCTRNHSFSVTLGDTEQTGGIVCSKSGFYRRFVALGPCDCSRGKQR